MTISAHIKVNPVVGISQGKTIPGNVNEDWRVGETTTARV
jgi:hypothetical protein